MAHDTVPDLVAAVRTALQVAQVRDFYHLPDDTKLVFMRRYYDLLPGHLCNVVLDSPSIRGAISHALTLDADFYGTRAGDPGSTEKSITTLTAHERVWATLRTELLATADSGITRLLDSY